MFTAAFQRSARAAFSYHRPPLFLC
jgi:hypothetical protein